MPYNTERLGSVPWGTQPVLLRSRRGTVTPALSWWTQLLLAYRSGGLPASCESTAPGNGINNVA